jgi:hypothetical protein
VPTSIRRSSPTRFARRLGALSAAILAAAPCAAHADPPRAPAPRAMSLGWVRLPGAEACIGSRALAIAVERHLRREVFVPPPRATSAIEGRIERTPDGFRAVITMSNEAGVPVGTREIQSAGPRCAAINDDLALVVAVMIDPDAALAPPLPVDPAPPPLTPPPPVRVERPPPLPWYVSLQAGGVAMFGLLPGVAGGVSIRSHVEPPRFWGFEVGGVVFPTVTAQQGNAGAKFHLAEAFVVVCPLTLHAFGGALSACAGLRAGAIHAEGFGYRGATAQEQGVVDAAIEGRVRRRIVGPLLAAAGIGLVVPFLREKFTYTTAGMTQPLFQTFPVAGAVDLSLGVEFP